MTVKDPAGLAWFIRYRLLMLLGQELTEILSEKKNHCSGIKHCTEDHESHYQTRLGTWGFQTTNMATPYRCIKKKI